MELSKCHSPVVLLSPMIFFFFAVLDGIVKISRMRILRNCTYRGTPGAFGSCTALRTSHSLSSLRACHLGVHGYMVQCGVSQVALGLTCCIVCPSVHVLQVRRVSGTMTLFWRSVHFGFYVVLSVSDCVFVLSECCHRCGGGGVGRVCVCVSRLSQLRLCPYLRVPEHHCGTYPSESMGIFVEVLQVQCCWRALFSDRARLGAQAALVS